MVEPHKGEASSSGLATPSKEMVKFIAIRETPGVAMNMWSESLTTKAVLEHIQKATEDRKTSKNSLLALYAKMVQICDKTT